MRDWRRQAAEGRVVPGTHVRLVRRLDRATVDAFGALIRDANPVHVEPRFAEARGLPGLICHGLLVGGMLCEPGGQWAWLASEMTFRFRRPVLVGDTVTLDVTVTDVDARGFARATGVWTNDRGEVVLDATLAGYLPGPDQRAVLADMLAAGDPTNPYG